MTNPRGFFLALLLALGGCGSAIDAGSVDHTSSTDSSLSGCHGKASSSQPSDGIYYLTTFGGVSESQPMSCGSNTSSGSWYYAASKSRFGCGAHIRIRANGHCVVAQVADYGPDVCVEAAAGREIIDASPLVGRALWGESELGWSDRRTVSVEVVDSGTALGSCDGTPIAPADPTAMNPTPPPAPGETPPSGTPIDTQPPSDGGPVCYSHTLQAEVPEGACVQSGTNQLWYQCSATLWYRLDSNGQGPDGDCTAIYS